MPQFDIDTRERRPYWRRLADRLPWYALVGVVPGAFFANSSWAREQVFAKALAWAVISGIAVGSAWLIAKLWAIVRAALAGRPGPAQADATFLEAESDRPD